MRRFWSRHERVLPTEPPIGTPRNVGRMFRACTDGAALAAAARRRTGPGLEETFRRYVDGLDRAGYTFGSLDDDRLQFDQPVAYLRYDVHVRDLIAVFLLAALHEQLRIPGSFQICWGHSRPEIEVADVFRKLLAFDRRYISVGLHCAPEASWIIAERFAGDQAGLVELARPRSFARLTAEWRQLIEREGADAPALVAARNKADAALARTNTSFRRAFGPARTISAHGTPLSAAFLHARSTDKGISVLAPYLHAVHFLDDERIARYGFIRELTRVGTDELGGPRIIFENPAEQLPLQYGARMAARAGFVALSHPATWTSGHFLPLLESIAAGAR